MIACVDTTRQELESAASLAILNNVKDLALKGVILNEVKDLAVKGVILNNVKDLAVKGVILNEVKDLGVDVAVAAIRSPQPAALGAVS